MVKIESKEKLAKLLAMEDIDIQHRNVRTAMFDVKNRVLTLPIWKDMPNHLYDLFINHSLQDSIILFMGAGSITKWMREIVL